MAITIAVAGKGGTGKTTLSGFLIDYLCKTGRSPILAVDADANSNLNEVLGVDVEMTLGDIREDITEADMNPSFPSGMTKQDYMNLQFSNAIIEEDDYDMIVMGRSQGKGCYCFVNGLLQTQIQRYASQYKYIVVDNEAGMEHISRGILPTIDYVLLISDCSRRGVQAVARIAELIGELKLNPKAVKLIVNRAPETGLDSGTLEEIEKHGLDLAGVIPQDELIYEYDCEGRPTVTLPLDSKARTAFTAIVSELLN